jgi:hypothetical protein
MRIGTRVGGAERERIVCALGRADKQVQALERGIDRIILLLEHAAEMPFRTGLRQPSSPPERHGQQAARRRSAEIRVRAGSVVLQAAPHSAPMLTRGLHDPQASSLYQLYGGNVCVI